MIDFFYSVFLMLLLVVVILGSFTVMTLQRTGYLEALTCTVFLTAGAVLLIGLAWNPRSGFAGLNVFFSRYLFSIGLPVEKWLQMLAELTAARGAPGALPRRGGGGAAARAVGVRGAPGARARRERRARQRARRTRSSSTTRRSRSPSTRATASSPALHWHLHLLGQLLGEFYLAKLREEELRQASYLQAVHETGARMTHDIKNLLQSLNVLVAAAARDEARDSPELQALMRRQLPVMCAAPGRDAGEAAAAARGRRDLRRGAGLVGGARAPVPRRGRRVRRRRAGAAARACRARCSTAWPTT